MLGGKKLETVNFIKPGIVLLSTTFQMVTDFQNSFVVRLSSK